LVKRIESFPLRHTIGINTAAIIGITSLGSTKTDLSFKLGIDLDKANFSDISRRLSIKDTLKKFKLNMNPFSIA
jgi:hypothetical protein